LGIGSAGASRTNVVSNVSVIATPLMWIIMLGEASTLTIIAGTLVAAAGIFTVSELA
jgi:hypothetical protein